MKTLLALILVVISTAAIAGAGLNMRWGSPMAFRDGGTGSFAATTTLGTQGIKFSVCGIVNSDAATVPLSHVGIHIQGVTGTPAAGSYQVSLQATDTSGNPNGVLGGGTPASGTFGGALSVGFQWIALANSYTASRGDLLCAVVERVAATDAANKIEINITGSAIPSTQLPYTSNYNGTTWTHSYGGSLISWRNSDSSVIGGGFPMAGTSGIAQLFFGGTGNPSEAGISFTLPTQMCSTATVKGIRWDGWTMTGSTTNTYRINLYSLAGGVIGGAPTAIQSGNAYVNNAEAVPGFDGGTLEVYFPGSLSTLTCGTKYVVAISTSVNGDGSYVGIATATNTDMNRYAFQQQTASVKRQNAAYPPAASAVVFTEDDKFRPYIELILGDITPPAGGGATSGGFFVQ